MTRFGARLLTRRARRALDERGVTMIIFGLIITSLLVIVAIVIDLGNARQQKRQLQNSADAAALAGASVINATTATCTGGDMLHDALKYAYNNAGITGSVVACPSSGVQYGTGPTVTAISPYSGGPPAFASNPNALINVRICKDVGTTFGKLVNISSIHVCGNATARKLGVTTPAGGGGTTTSDPGAPCTADAFTSNGYFDHDSHFATNPKNDAGGLNVSNQAMKTTTSGTQSGGAAGGVVVENDWVGATYWSTTPIDFTTNPPTVTFTNVTTQAPQTLTETNGWGASATGGPIYISKPLTSVNGVAVPAGIFAYDIGYKVVNPGGGALPNNTQYSVLLTVYDSASSSNPPNGKCGKAQWSFTKGTVPSSGGTSPCVPGSSGVVENNFLGSIFPGDGSNVHKGDSIGAVFQDESPIYNGTTGNVIVFTIDGTAIPQGTLGTPSAQGPNTVAAPGSTTSVYTLRSPTQLITTGEKYSTDIQYKLPTTISGGSHTIKLQAFDTDSNKAGGDCGVATWTINVAGSNVELVQ